MAHERRIHPHANTDDQGWWEQNLRDLQGHDFMTESELTDCLKKGSISIATLRSILDKISAAFSPNQLMIKGWEAKLRRHLNISEEAWNKNIKTE